MDAEIAWAAGLFEGEGCIEHLVRGGFTRRMLSVTSTDRDVLEHFQEVVACGTITGPTLRSGRKPLYVWRTREWQSIERVLTLFLPILGSRRRAKAETLLSDPASFQGRRDLTHCSRGHPRTPENLYVSPKGKRNCRPCARENAANQSG